MATTASHLKADDQIRRFYYIKITGIPYYFMCVIDPTSSVYGTFKWTLPAGYTSVIGMDLPDVHIEQALPDLVGGIATAERIRISLCDFEAFDANGKFSYLARIFAPGRLALQVGRSELSSSIRSTAVAGGTFTVADVGAAVTIGGSTPWVAHVGGEAIGISAPVVSDADGKATLTIATRNMYPCKSDYPPVPYHLVMKDETGTVITGKNETLSSEPYTLLGRSIALYCGHIEPNGMPCLESETLCRFIGRITSMDYGEMGGRYEIGADTIVADLARAQVAPNLAIAQIKPDQLVILGEYGFMSVSAGLVDVNVNAVRETCQVQIPPGTYDIETLVNKINQQLIAGFPDLGVNSWVPRCQINSMGGVRRVNFSALEGHRTKDVYNIRVKNGRTNSVTRTFPIGLMSVLGFDDADYYESKAGTSSDFDVIVNSTMITQEIVCENPLPSIFIPFDSVGPIFNVTGDATAFFSDQGDNTSGVAYVRFPDNRLVRMISSTSTTLRTGATPVHGAFTPHKPTDKTQGGWGYFRCSRGETATIEQVVVLPPTASTPVNAATIVGELLASNGRQAGGYNVFPDGIGLGLDAILDSESIQKLGDDGSPRAVVVDSTTTFEELFTPFAKEYGWFFVWNPLITKYQIRPVRVPSAPKASDISLLDSNKADYTKRTEMRIDQTSLRSAWTLEWGWDRIEGKFLGSQITLNDSYVMSSYGGAIKKETVKDKTLAIGGSSNGFAVTALMLERSYLYRQPWMKCKRTMKMSGLLIAPGSAHLIVDSTIINPFTGNMGITAADRQYGLVTKVAMNLATGIGDVEFVINRQDPSNVFRQLAPTGLLDFAATGHGYDSATGAIVFDSHYVSDGTSKDGIDFVVGDTIAIVQRDSDGTPYEVVTTIATLSGDGHTGTVAPGLGSPGNFELIAVLREYANATVGRQGDTAFQGRVSGKIQNLVKNHKWQ